MPWSHVTWAEEVFLLLVLHIFLGVPRRFSFWRSSLFAPPPRGFSYSVNSVKLGLAPICGTDLVFIFRFIFPCSQNPRQMTNISVISPFCGQSFLLSFHWGATFNGDHFNARISVPSPAPDKLIAKVLICVGI